MRQEGTRDERSARAAPLSPAQAIGAAPRRYRAEIEDARFWAQQLVYLRDEPARAAEAYACMMRALKRLKPGEAH